jgi:hypothetical protein
MDCFHDQTNNCDGVDFLSPVSIIEIKSKKNAAKKLPSHQKIDINKSKNCKSPKSAKSIGYKFLVQFKTKLDQNGPSKKKVWVPNLGFIATSKRISLLKDFKNHFLNMANADSTLAEYSQSQLDNLDAHSKTHDYEVNCSFKYDPKPNQITPFREITNQISNKSEPHPKFPYFHSRLKFINRK